MDKSNGKISKIKKIVVPILREYGAEKAALFGSYVRGQMKKDSDIDILVDIKKDISLFDFIELKQKIEKAVGNKVDLIEYDTIKPLLRDKILSEQIIIL